MDGKASSAVMQVGPGFEVSVPGSISNLGPAFDALAVAVELYVRVRVVDVSPSAPDVIETEFDGSAPGGENRIEVAFRRARGRIGVATPGIRVRACSEIPVRAGLGSSAAATIAGLKLYEALTSRGTVTDWLAVATEIEGHPDNAAAALLGGLTLSCQRDDGHVIARAWRWPPALRFVVATPDRQVETERARRVLPQNITLRDAVFNLQRALLLVRALETGKYEDLREAIKDRWHQSVRAPLVPVLRAALEIDDPAVLAVCLSGSGSSIVALVSDDGQRAADILRQMYARERLQCTIRTLAACQPGLYGDM